MEKHEKFLQFNGRKIVFLCKDGTYWIALKPICEALNVDVRRSRELAKNDPILGPELRNQALQVGENGDLQARPFTCLPEQFIYGWLFMLRSSSEELINYKRDCYKLLYQHFHGTITNRRELLMERREVDKQIHEINEQLKEQNAQYQELKNLMNKRKTLSTQLNTIDKELVKQKGLFDEE